MDIKRLIKENDNNNKDIRKCMTKVSKELVKCMKQVAGAHHDKYSKNKNSKN
jgi:hypothetical protein